MGLYDVPLSMSLLGFGTIIIIIIIFIRINNYTYRVHIKHLGTNYICLPTSICVVLRVCWC